MFWLSSRHMSCRQFLTRLHGAAAARQRTQAQSSWSEAGEMSGLLSSTRHSFFLTQQCYSLQPKEDRRLKLALSPVSVFV